MKRSTFKPNSVAQFNYLQYRNGGHTRVECTVKFSMHVTIPHGTDNLTFVGPCQVAIANTINIVAYAYLIATRIK